MEFDAGMYILINFAMGMIIFFFLIFIGWIILGPVGGGWESIRHKYWRYKRRKHMKNPPDYKISMKDIKETVEKKKTLE